MGEGGGETDTMGNNDVFQYLYEMERQMCRTKDMVKENNQTLDQLLADYEASTQERVALQYSDGFWDGFMSGSVLMVSILTGFIYFLR